MPVSQHVKVKLVCQRCSSGMELCVPVARNVPQPIACTPDGLLRGGSFGGSALGLLALRHDPVAREAVAARLGHPVLAMAGVLLADLGGLRRFDLGRGGAVLGGPLRGTQDQRHADALVP